MNAAPPADWDPLAEEVQRNQLAAYDAMRERCPVAFSEFLGWSLFRHEDVLNALRSPDLFSSVVSERRAVPSGMDPPEHTEYRRIVDGYFQPAEMEAFEPRCRRLAGHLVEAVHDRGSVEFNTEFAQPFAIRAQCEFLGWPDSLHGPLGHWIGKSHAATIAGDRSAMAEIAGEFEACVHQQLAARRVAAHDVDLTSRLMHERVSGRPINDAELVSILRNWTAGEVGTIAAALTILAEFLSSHIDWQRRLRQEPDLLPRAIDEILRIQGPLVANRRTVTRDCEIRGRRINAGEKVSLNWIAANRDGHVFQDPTVFRLDRDPAKNLLYGAGIHVCPGAPLARLQMRIVLEELLGGTTSVERTGEAIPARYPASGYSHLRLRIE